MTSKNNSTENLLIINHCEEHSVEAAYAKITRLYFATKHPKLFEFIERGKEV